MTIRLFDLGGPLSDARRSARNRRSKRAFHAEQTCEQLEGRVVLSHFGGGFSGAMAAMARGRNLGGAGGYGGGADVGGFAATGGMSVPVGGMSVPVGGMSVPVGGMSIGSGIGGLGGPGGVGGQGVGSLTGSLASIGVIGGDNAGVQGMMSLPNAPTTTTTSSSTTSTELTQLQTDMQTLQTELQSVVSSSGVTAADLNHIGLDEQALMQAGAQIDQTAMQKVVTELATAITSGASTSQAQTDFTALFSNTSVSSTTITKAFTDLTQTITDSKITSNQLSTITADQAAVQKDQTILQASSPMGLPGGGALVQNLSTLGVLSGMQPGASNVGGMGAFGGMGVPGGMSGQSSSSSSSSNAGLTQLQTDMQKLQTDLQAVASSSGVTIADVTNLKNDAVAIAQTGTTLDRTALSKAISELATAVASGADTTQAQTDFTALFSGTSVSSTTINQAFTDLTKAITDSKITSTELSTIASDQAAIQTDMTNLQGIAATLSSTSTTTTTTTSTAATTTAATTSPTTTTAATTSRHGWRRMGRHGRR